MSKKSNQFSPEVRERAVRMVREHRGEYPSLWATIESIAPTRGRLKWPIDRKNGGRSVTTGRPLFFWNQRGWRNW